MSGFFNKYVEKAQNAINASPLASHIPPQLQQHLGGAQASTGPSVTSGNPQAGVTDPSAQTQHGATTPAPGGLSHSQTSTPQPPGSYGSVPHSNTIHATGPGVQGHSQAQGGGSSAAGGGVVGMMKQHGFSTVQNQLRSLKAQYSKGDDRQVQLAIIAQKSVLLDYEAVGRDAQSYSKELYLWGQEQHAEDLKDVTDRVAYLNFVHGSLNTDLSSKLDTARGPWKAVRASEGTIGTLKGQGQPTDKVTQESEIEKRVALRQGEAARWKAIREYAEKLILLSQAADVLIEEALPESPLAQGEMYSGKQRTAGIRSTLQRSLDNWSPSPAISAASPFTASGPNTQAQGSYDPRSFGETHSAELSRTPSILEKADDHSHPPSAFPGSHPGGSVPSPAGSLGSTHQLSTGVNPATLNNEPAPVPIPASHSQSPQATIPSTAPLNIRHGPGSPQDSITTSPGGRPSPVVLDGASGPLSSSPPTSAGTLPVSHPTVAETGVPISSSSGPGPASGSLKPAAGAGTAAALGAAAAAAAPSWGAGYTPAPSSTSGGALQASGAPTAKYETADDEKKRLEREERERILRYGTGVGGGASANNASAPAPSYGAPAGPPPGASASASSALAGTPAPIGLGGGSVYGKPKYESAEDEKKRLERENREKILHGQESSGTGGGAGGPPNQQQNPQDHGADGPPEYSA